MKTQKKPVIDMLVIRLNKIGTLKNSKPCLHCILDIEKICKKKKIKIRYIYYSINDNIIIKKKFSELKEETKSNNYYITRGNR